MKTITKEYNVFKYEELSEDAKEKAKQWYLEGQDAYIFEDMCACELDYLFPNSSLDIQYSLGYCQGDGFNIYGNLSLEDIFNALDIFTEKEKRTLKFYNNFCDINLPKNDTRYSYCVCEYIDLFNDWEYELENQGFKNINKETIQKLEKSIIHIFSELCDKYEQQGYNFFYEVSEDDMIETCEVNEYTFLEDGTIFY